MEHTKGKWKLDKSGVATAIKSGDVFVASIYNRDKRIKGDGITEVWGNDAYDTSETDANASLIASAPEMLRIIKDVVIIEKKLGHDGSSVFWRCEDFLSKIKKTNKKGEIK